MKLVYSDYPLEYIESQLKLKNFELKLNPFEPTQKSIKLTKRKRLLKPIILQKRELQDLEEKDSLTIKKFAHEQKKRLEDNVKYIKRIRVQFEKDRLLEEKKKL